MARLLRAAVRSLAIGLWWTLFASLVAVSWVVEGTTDFAGEVQRNGHGPNGRERDGAAKVWWQ